MKHLLILKTVLLQRILETDRKIQKIQTATLIQKGETVVYTVSTVGRKDSALKVPST